MVAFNTQVIEYLVIPSGATTGQRIVIDGVNGVILIYDSSNVLVDSITFGPGTDGTGQSYLAGITSYNDPQRGSYAQLFNGALALSTPLATTPGGADVFDNTGVNGDQPVLQVFSPAVSGFPQPNAAYVQLFGANAANTEQPYVWIGSRGGPAQDINVLIGGQLRYTASSGGLGSGVEDWHQPTLNTNWANTGSGFGNFAYRRNALGAVEFTGLIQWNGAATPAPDPVFTLPVGYRPDRTVHVVALSSPGPGTNPTTENIEVTSAGVVQVTNYSSGPNTPLSFENVAFYLTGAH
jgi:hypothetical protein